MSNIKLDAYIDKRTSRYSTLTSFFSPAEAAEAEAKVAGARVKQYMEMAGAGVER